jgi:hypothetical protein
MKTQTTLLLATLTFLSTQIEAAVVNNHVYIDPPSQSLQIGDIFSVNVIGENFNLGLDGGSFDLAFDSSILRADSVSLNTATWNFAAVKGIIDNPTGKIIFTDFAQFGANTTNNSFNIATFSFQAIGSGNSQLTLLLNDNDPFATGGEIAPVNFSHASVNVAAVPLPAAFWLFGSALIGGISLRNKKIVSK